MHKKPKIPLRIIIQQDDFDVSEETKKIIVNRSGEIGAVVNFLGVVRDVSKGEKLQFMELEHYPGMTEKALRNICLDAEKKWSLHGITIIHRVGKLYPSDKIVLVLVSSQHRREAFLATEFIMDFLKTRAPFWKKETLNSQSKWVEEKASDISILGRWS